MDLRTFAGQVVERADVVALISRHVELKRAGANYLGRCPFHQEKTPSFTVSPSKQFYYCFGCGAHGTAISFLMDYSRHSYIEAVKILASEQGLRLPPELEHTRAKNPEQERLRQSALGLLEQAAAFYNQRLHQQPQALAYLVEQRCLSLATIERFALGYAPQTRQGLAQLFPNYLSNNELITAGLVIEADNGERHDRFRDRIMFPIRNERQQVVGFGGRVLAQGQPKYLNSPESALFDKSRLLYGLERLKPALKAEGQVVVVEGYMDVIALSEHGFDAAVASLGTALTEANTRQLLRLSDKLVLCFDGDQPGIRAAWRAVEKILPLVSEQHQIQVTCLPDEHDPDSFIRSQGLDAFRQLMQQSPSLSEFFFQFLSTEHDVKSIEGQARFIKKATDLIGLIASASLRTAMLEKLARVSGVSVNHLMFDTTAVKKTEKNYRSNRPGFIQPPLSLEKKLLRMLLLHPQEANNIEGIVTKPGEREALVALIELLHEHPEIDNAAQVFELSQDSTWHETYVEQMSAIEEDNNADIGIEIAEAVNKLKLSDLRAEREQLLHLGLDANNLSKIREIDQQMKLLGHHRAMSKL